VRCCCHCCSIIRSLFTVLRVVIIVIFDMIKFVYPILYSFLCHKFFARMIARGVLVGKQRLYLTYQSVSIMNRLLQQFHHSCAPSGCCSAAIIYACQQPHSQREASAAISACYCDSLHLCNSLTAVVEKKRVCKIDDYYYRLAAG
jgi:hypothetical protein